MKIAIVSRILLLAMMFASTSGCATRALWTGGTFDEFNEPAPDPHLSIHPAESKNDFLVVYDEISGRHESVHRRAYWLEENERRRKKGQYPHFVDETLARSRASIPVFLATNAAAIGQQSGIYALLSTDSPVRFTLFSDNAELNSYLLPVYDDGKGTTARVALTPLTVTADAVIVGGFAGYLYLQGVAENGGFHNFP